MTAATLRSALAELEQTIRERDRIFKGRVERGAMTEKRARERQANLRKAHERLMFLAANEDWILHIHAQRLALAEQQAEACEGT